MNAAAPAGTTAAAAFCLILIELVTAKSAYHYIYLSGQF
jgi:hypothetical protein